MKFEKYFTGYLERAYNLLKNNDEVNLTYCALELRRAIELIIWTQFIAAFRSKISESGMYRFEYSKKLQNHGISIMYELLKKHIRDYADQASRGIIFPQYEFKYGDVPDKKYGEICYIHPKLPTSDYDYLSFILHYEKESIPKKFRTDKKKLLEIYKRLMFLKDHYTSYGYLRVDTNVDNISNNIKKAFKLTNEQFKSFPKSRK
jgi:hypothetical protein